MKLNKNQLSFLLEAIALSNSEMVYENYYEEESKWVREWTSMKGSGKYKLTDDEIDELTLLIIRLASNKCDNPEEIFDKNTLETWAGYISDRLKAR